MNRLIQQLQGNLMHPPRFHGNGFVQLYLTPSSRLHIWHPNLKPTRPGAEIHDHRFSFTSTVVLGTLIHEEFEVLFAPNGLLRIYEVFAPTRFPELPPPRLIGRCETRLSSTKMIHQDDSYSFASGYFHRSIPCGLTATIIEKHGEQERNAYCISDREIGHAHANEVTLEAMNAVVEEVLCRLK